MGFERRVEGVVVPVASVLHQASDFEKGLDYVAGQALSLDVKSLQRLGSSIHVQTLS